MKLIVERAGYVPAVKVGSLLFCAGQIGRRADLSIIKDPEEQFEACWVNLEMVLNEAGCRFEDVIEMTTYHVRMNEHLKLFVEVKDRVFPRGKCAWTCIGVAELAYEDLLVEVKVVAHVPEKSET